MERLELKIPPPAIASICGLAMWLSARHFPALGVEIPFKPVVCGVLVLLGLFFDLSGFFAFRERRTTINPLRPERTSAVVSQGIYRHTRNPMYVGLFCILGAWALWLANLPAFGVLPLFVAYLTRFQIIPEERILTERFGEDYTEYARMVPRWF